MDYPSPHTSVLHSTENSQKGEGNELPRPIDVVSALGKRRLVSHETPPRKRRPGPCSPKLTSPRDTSHIHKIPLRTALNEKLSATSQTPPATKRPTMKLSPEQLALIERNKQRALELQSQSKRYTVSRLLPLKKNSPSPPSQSDYPSQPSNKGYPSSGYPSRSSLGYPSPIPLSQKQSNLPLPRAATQPAHLPPKGTVVPKKPQLKTNTMLPASQSPFKTETRQISPTNFRYPPLKKKPTKKSILVQTTIQLSPPKVKTEKRTFQLSPPSSFSPSPSNSSQKGSEESSQGKEEWKAPITYPTVKPPLPSHSSDKEQSSTHYGIVDTQKMITNPPTPIYTNNNSALMRSTCSAPSSSKGNSKSSKSSGWTPMAANQRESTKIGDSMSSTIVDNPWGTKNKNRDKYFWLTHRVDSQRRAPDHPDFDPSSVFIPCSEHQKLTENQQIYWNFKKDHYDTIVFYQGGSFYELYGEDALVGAKIFDMKISQRSASMPMVGFPTHSYDKFASKFVALGYKVARMDQFVDPKTKQVTKRVLADYVTPGTLIDSPLLGDYSKFLLAIYEEAEHFRYGLCFIDCSLASFYLGVIHDDKYQTHLKTLLLQIKPSEVIYLSANISRKTMMWIKKLANPLLTCMAKEKSVSWSSSWMVSYLNDYYPSLLAHETYNQCKDSEATLAAWGGCLSYLSDLQGKDMALMNQGKLYDYKVIQKESSLIIDGESLLSLEILQNNLDHSSHTTLWSVLMNCQSAIGKRLFSKWICYPLRDIHDINERLDAVEELISQVDISLLIGSTLRKLPDLDRSLSRIRARSIPLKAALEFLRGLEEILILIETYGHPSAINQELSTNHGEQEPFQFSSSYLSRLTTVTTKGGDFPPILNDVIHFSEGIDRETSLERNLLVPKAGFSTEYDTALQTVQKNKCIIDGALDELKEELSLPNLKYKHTAQQKYQVEISNKYLEQNPMPSRYILVKTLKNVTRFFDPTVVALVSKLSEAEENLEIIAAGQLQHFVEQLNEHVMNFEKAIDCISQLDCLLSLSKVSSSGGFHTMCRPTFKNQSNSFVAIRDLVHPFLHVNQDSEVIPNDIFLGGDQPRGILLTGPNMGGKSTLLRQACIAIIMAQLGCFVPASSCELTPMDRIFTRIGANDNIFEGQSTFMVELEETAQILNNATNHSFIILDELGRGTSTFDGTAIAHSVLHYLLKTKQSLLIFATHYHLLVEDWKNEEALALYHMSCFEDIEENMVTFLYKAIEGACPSSRGMNVARMAQLPEEIIATAEKISKRFEISFGTTKEALVEQITACITQCQQEGKMVNCIAQIWEALATQYSRR